MKRPYDKPAMKTVLLHQQNMLTISGEISGYKKSSGGFSQEEGGSNPGGNVKGQGGHGVWNEDWSN